MIKIGNARFAAAASATAALATTVASAMPAIEGWRVPSNLEILSGSSPALNTPAVDGCVSLSADGLTLAFTSNRTGNFDLYLATRRSTAFGFGPPFALPAPINTGSNESCPTIAGNRLYFSSDRDDPAYDLYVSQNTTSGWSNPVHLGPNVNRPGTEEESAALQTLNGHEVLTFSSRNLDGSGGVIFESVDGRPGVPVLGGVNAAGSNNRPSLSVDGRTIYFDSDRQGSLGGPDIYYATRPNAFGPFGAAVHLPSVSSPAVDARPWISADGKMLVFSSNRPGSTSPAPDMWFASR